MSLGIGHAVIIAAPPGFRLVRTYLGDKGVDLGDDPVACSEIVIAFVVDPADSSDGNSFPLPITCTGKPDGHQPWALVHPDGHLSMGRDLYGSFVDWKRNVGLDPWP